MLLFKIIWFDFYFYDDVYWVGIIKWVKLCLGDFIELVGWRVGGFIILVDFFLMIVGNDEVVVVVWVDVFVVVVSVNGLLMIYCEIVRCI